MREEVEAAERRAEKEAEEARRRAEIEQEKAARPLKPLPRSIASRPNGSAVATPMANRPPSPLLRPRGPRHSSDDEPLPQAQFNTLQSEIDARIERDMQEARDLLAKFGSATREDAPASDSGSCSGSSSVDMDL